jgi:hypothetical protein
VVIHDLYIVSARVLPPETHTPPIVDANAIFARSVACELLEAIARRKAQILERLRRIDEEQFAESDALELAVQPLDALPPKEPLGLIVPKAPDHKILMIAPCANNVKR